MAIYRTEDGRAALERHYARALERLGDPERLRVGTTRVWTDGPKDAPPLLMLHGAGADGPLLLGMLRPLAAAHRLLVPDLPGFPGQSAPDLPGDWATWVAELLDGLHLDRCAVVGMSYGASVILRAGARIPDRLTRAALLCPAGLVRPPLGTAIPTLASLAAYRLAPTPRRLRRAVGPLLTEHDEERADRIGDVIRHVRGVRLPPLARPADLARFRSPTLVLAGAEDPWFPGHLVAARAPRVLPGLVAAESIAGWAHVPSPAVLAVLNARLRSFLGT